MLRVVGVLERKKLIHSWYGMAKTRFGCLIELRSVKKSHASNRTFHFHKGSSGMHKAGGVRDWQHTHVRLLPGWFRVQPDDMQSSHVHASMRMCICDGMHLHRQFDFFAHKTLE